MATLPSEEKPISRPFICICICILMYLNQNNCRTIVFSVRKTPFTLQFLKIWSVIAVGGTHFTDGFRKHFFKIFPNKSSLPLKCVANCSFKRFGHRTFVLHQYDTAKRRVEAPHVSRPVKCVVNCSSVSSRF